MSYNTRRQTGQGMGMSKSSSPGMYHPRPPRMPHQNSYQPNYSSQQSSPYSNQNQGGVQQHPSQQQQQQQQPQPPSQQPPQQSQAQQQPLSQPPPPPPPQPPQQHPPLPQQQSAPQPPQSQGSQQQLPLQAPPQPPEQLQQAGQSPPAAVKTEPPGTPAPAASMEVDPEKPNDGSAEPKQKPWQKKRFPAFKVNKKIKRRRQNARLRKLLQPKNAMMVLHELKAGIKFTFQEHTNALTQTMFVVNAEVDGKVYVGQGLSKPIAKQNAAENALKALLLEKMSDAAMKAQQQAQQQDNAEGEAMQQDANNGAGSGDSGEGSDAEGTGTPGKPPAPEDDVPWGSLASFALYKLFTEWQNQGTHVPIPVPKQGPVIQAAAAAQPMVPGTPSPMKKIPENPTDRHPVMLLNQLKPGIQFTEVGREGTPPNLTFTMAVTVDGKTYNGVARNKKEAKKEAAINCLAGSFNIHY